VLRKHHQLKDHTRLKRILLNGHHIAGNIQIMTIMIVNIESNLLNEEIAIGILGVPQVLMPLGASRIAFLKVNLIHLDKHTNNHKEVS
jgi:hypothetical protein